MADRSTRSRGRSKHNNQSVSETEGLQEQLGAILARLHALEGSAAAASSRGAASHVEPSASHVEPPSSHAEPTATHVEPASSRVEPPSSLGVVAPSSTSQTPSLPLESTASTVSDLGGSSTTTPDATDRLIGALTALTKMTGKLDSGMRGPYRVTRVLPRGRYNLRLMGGSYGKTTQAAAEHMVVWRGEWTPESCAVFFDSEDDTELGTTSTDSNTEAVNPPADDNQPGPSTSATSNHAVQQSHAVAPINDNLAPESQANATNSPTRCKDSDSADVQDTGAPKLSKPSGRGRPRVRRGRKRR